MPSQHVVKLLNSGTSEEIRLDINNLRKVWLIIRSINHRLRQQIIRALSETPELTVTEIYIKVRREQSVASQHLAILRTSGVVAARRKGKFMYYTLNKERLKEITSLIKELTT
jgi:DNA-binding transcriptional ArsR family regulator